MTLRVAVVQTAPTLGAVDDNLGEVRRVVERLAGQVDVAIFPELFTTGYWREGPDHAALAERVPGRTTEWLGQLATIAGVSLIGTILEREGDAVFDTAIVIGPDGALRATYRKTHLYPAEREHFAAGDRFTVVDVGGTRIGLAICFEHAFPEIFAELALAGAQLVAIPSAVPVDYEYLLRLRTRARAQDNQLFVAAANLVGDDGHNVWCGGSMLVDPRGEVLAEANGTSPEVLVVGIDLDRIAAERAQEPVLANRRPDLYRRLASGSGTSTGAGD